MTSRKSRQMRAVCCDAATPHSRASKQCAAMVADSGKRGGAGSARACAPNRFRGDGKKARKKERGKAAPSDDPRKGRLACRPFWSPAGLAGAGKQLRYLRARLRRGR